MNGRTSRRYAAGLGLVAVTASVPTAALAFATPDPPDPCRMYPLPSSCADPTIEMARPASAVSSTTVVTAVINASLTTVTATYVPLTATVSGTPTALAPTAAVATPTVDGTPTPLTFTLQATPTSPAVPLWMPPPE